MDKMAYLKEIMKSYIKCCFEASSHCGIHHLISFLHFWQYDQLVIFSKTSFFYSRKFNLGWLLKAVIWIIYFILIFKSKFYIFMNICIVCSSVLTKKGGNL